MKRKLGYLALLLLGIGLITVSFMFWRSAQANTENDEVAEDDEVIENDEVREDDLAIDEEFLREMEGTVVAILEDEGEVLFVEELNLSVEELSQTAEEWLTSDIYRLTGIGSDVSIGTEIRISFAITTMSIPPLAPVESYEVLR